MVDNANVLTVVIKMGIAEFGWWEDSRPDRQPRAEAPLEPDKYVTPQSSWKTSPEGSIFCSDGKLQHEHGSWLTPGDTIKPLTVEPLLTSDRERKGHAQSSAERSNGGGVLQINTFSGVALMAKENGSGDEASQLEGDKQGGVDALLNQTGGPPDVLGEKVGHPNSPKQKSFTALIEPALPGPPTGDPDKAKFGDGPELVTGAGLTLTMYSRKKRISSS
ncbi:hypothetical protein Ancab_029580 [Ancistrocladus abbreviatus]